MSAADLCRNCGHAREIHEMTNGYQPYGRCNFQHDLCGCANFQPESSAAKGTEVTCRDIETGESETQTITNDYVVICDGNRYIDGVVAYSNGTAVITIKKTKP